MIESLVYELKVALSIKDWKHVQAALKIAQESLKEKSKPKIRTYKRQKLSQVS